MDISNLKIERLRNKENWHKWHFVIRTILEDDDDVLAVCEGKLQRPHEDPKEDEYEEKLQKFLKADKTARKLIVTTIEDKPLELIMGCTSAREMWTKLSSVYDRKSDETLSIVQKQFFDYKWVESESVAQNISKLEILSKKMHTLGSSLPKGMLLTRILSCLPKKYNHFHSAWDSVEESKKNLENLTDRLMAEEARLQEKDDTCESSTALMSKLKVGNEKQKNEYHRHIKNYPEKKKEGLFCTNCGRTNHLKKDCFRCFECKRKGHRSYNCRQKKSSNITLQVENEVSSSHPGSSPRIALLGVKGENQKTDMWALDSGATDHMTHRRDWFSSYEEFAHPVNVKISNGDYMAAYGIGNIDLESYVDGNRLECTLQDVLYTPDLINNLFSTKCAGKKGIDCLITNFSKQCFLMKNKQIIAVGHEFGNLLKLDVRVKLPKACNFSKQIEPVEQIVKSNRKIEKSDDCYSLQLWHERLCHQNVKYVRNFLKNANIKFINDDFFCDACAYGKQHRLPFHAKTDRATEVRELIYTDVCGPMEVESLGKKSYFVTFKDDFSGFRYIYFIKHKSEVVDKLKIFCLEVENQFGRNIKEIHRDGGKEYDNQWVKRFLNERGIKVTVNTPYTPEQNGVAERENRIIVEAARSMLHANANLPKYLWAEAINMAVFVINRTAPTRHDNKKSPYELWYNKEPNVDKLKIFGTECFVHIPVEKRKKLDKKAIKGYLVGYHENFKGYRVYVPSLRDVVVSRDVLFKPEKVSNSSVNVPLNNEKIKDIVNENENGNIVENTNNSCEDNDYKLEETLQEPVQSVQVKDNNQGGRELRNRSQRKQTEFYGFPVAHFSHLAKNIPNNYNEAIMNDEKGNWLAAMQDEINSLYENGTWVLVDKPENRKIIDNRWVYTRKVNADGTDRYKARLVIKGYSQKPGVDFNETFSPVARFDTIRFMLSIAALFNLKLGQFDVKTAFLHGNLKEDIYMKQPEGFNDGTNRVCKLKKSLYGLKQAPRCWTDHFKNLILNLGFYQSTADPCFYIYRKENDLILLTIYVDDGLLAASKIELIDKILNDLSKEFTIKSIKDVKNFLGIEISRLKDGSVFIHQSSFIAKILEEFNMSSANPVSTPIDCSFYDIISEKVMYKLPYREAVGSLMFLQIVSRPDISFAVNIVSRELENPSEKHWLLVKRIMRYLKGTINVGILYSKNGMFEAYSDADFAGDKIARKSTSGFVCKFANGPITWQSKKQQCVALSTTEAEYISAATVTKEIIWLKKIFNECKINITTYNLYIDNMSAIKLIKNPEFHQRSKHIDVKYHFVRDNYQKGEINVTYVKSEEQIADIFTKALPKPKFEFLKEKLGLTNKDDIYCKDAEF